MYFKRILVPLDGSPFSEQALPLAESFASRGTKTQTLVTGSEPAYTIVEMADSVEADLIMLATHGRGGRDRLMFGSVADMVVRHSRRPVFLVPVRSAINQV